MSEDKKEVKRGRVEDWLNDLCEKINKNLADGIESSIWPKRLQDDARYAFRRGFLSHFTEVPFHDLDDKTIDEIEVYMMLNSRGAYRDSIT